MNNIWLIRHGQSRSNVGEKTTHPGRASLTEKGMRQSECIASYINNRPDIIISSPYLRAQQTAQPTINKFPGVTVDEWPVQEFVYLPHEKYRNTTRIERRSSVTEYWERCDPELKNSEEAESFIEFIDRMEKMFDKLKGSKGNVVVFTHGHVFRAMIWKIITGTLQNDRNAMLQYRSLRQALHAPNAAILKLNMDGPELQMSQLITSHLAPELLK